MGNKVSNSNNKNYQQLPDNSIYCNKCYNDPDSMELPIKYFKFIYKYDVECPYINQELEIQSDNIDISNYQNENNQNENNQIENNQNNQNSFDSYQRSNENNQNSINNAIYEIFPEYKDYSYKIIYNKEGTKYIQFLACKYCINNNLDLFNKF